MAQNETEIWAISTSYLDVTISETYSVFKICLPRSGFHWITHYTQTTSFKLLTF